MATDIALVPGESADEQAASPSVFGVVSLGAQPTFYFGEICEQSGDVSACTGGFAGVGPSVAFHWQTPWRVLQLGPRFGLNFEAGRRSIGTSNGVGPAVTTDLSRRVFDMQIEPRVQSAPADGAWLSVPIGAVHLQEVATTNGDSQIQVAAWAPLIGLAGGYDFLLEDIIALSVGGRVAWLPFNQQLEDLDGFVQYDNVYSVALLFEARYRL